MQLRALHARLNVFVGAIWGAPVDGLNFNWGASIPEYESSHIAIDQTLKSKLLEKA